MATHPKDLPPIESRVARTDARAASEMHDRTLMERVREGDAASLDVLVGRYWTKLFHYAMGLLRDRDSANDVVQETFIRIWRFREKWTPSGTVSAYLYHVARNLALNSGRDRRTRTGSTDVMRGTYLDRPPPSTPEQELESRRLEAEVRAAIDALPPRRREVFILSRFHQLTHEEIADTMEISSQTVANQMSSALSELRALLSQRLTDRGGG